MWPVPVSNTRPLDCEPDALPLCHRGHKPYHCVTFVMALHAERRFFDHVRKRGEKDTLEGVNIPSAKYTKCSSPWASEHAVIRAKGWADFGWRYSRFINCAVANLKPVVSKLFVFDWKCISFSVISSVFRIVLG